ncbi:MAG: SUMF1/EgtB/PvdO family nonheme iron enzyme, partial [Bryobacterales bacterium]|nr:SUMF1/EgtB/PvdO family nonheme iron enzyme [Bryobacterales bacterium]
MGSRRNSLEAIQEAFEEAFTVDDLRQLVTYRFPGLSGDVPWKEKARTVVLELVTAAQKDGSLDSLVAAAREKRPGNAKLAALPLTQGERKQHLDGLVEEVETKARLYSPLHGIGETRRTHRLLAAWEGDPCLAPLQHNSMERETKEYPDILEAFDKVERAVLLGDPGAGKSTTLRRLALELARRAEKEEGAALPLLADLGKWSGEEGLWEFLKGCAPKIGWAVEALARERQIVLLLDGLNEVPTGLNEVPTGMRGAKTAEVKQLRGCRLFVSCRREDYSGELDLKLDTLTLKPLSPQQIQGALRLWVTTNGEERALADQIFWELAGDARLGEVFERWRKAGLTEEMFWWASDLEKWWEHLASADYKLWRDELHSTRSLLRLAENPFLLTMLYQVRVAEGRLPKNRGDLFHRFTNCLLSRERLFVEEETGQWRLTENGNQLLVGLEQLAWGMQRMGRGSGVSTVAPRATVFEALGGETLLRKALDATILEGDGEVRFRHQLLQEYFTARALRGRFGQMAAEELWPREKWWERSGWEETAALLAGMHAQDCTPVIRWLRDAQPEVAAQCLLESGADAADREALRRELQAAWLPRLTDVEREPAPKGRAAIGRALGRLGLDNRKGVGLIDGVPDIDWVEIPGGEFVYQEGERRRSDTFWMARYPVTNAQYQAFLEAKDGYKNDPWWVGLTDPERTPASPEWSEGNHPREMVSWWEAMAFCGWLSDKLGFEVRLPTEWEWERAARGADGRVYPWGDQNPEGRANIFLNIGRTSAVGIYPQGASAEGVMDL